ncbi:hypothetical protein BJ875DRAFT_529551 [Amylocarpus encephaloides]|uniref:Uncharacterized protein n=1 Tax=Amylocarpus encephaloides TaxID=45428 RepID=A0A9P7YLF9_9HELO|nr:hypothetical protein BJ875DRAFT_529551 [Amylocarpus encephaloides]
MTIVSPSDAAWMTKVNLPVPPPVLLLPERGTTDSRLAGSHSFAAYGFGNDGNLVIDMTAFHSMTFNAASNLLNYGITEYRKASMSPTGGLSKYTYMQSLTLTADKPLTSESDLTTIPLQIHTALAFNRIHFRKSSYLDLGRNFSRDIKDPGTSYAHGNNVWLSRWEANLASSRPTWPADGV